MPTLPITIIGGYLGAGKTTLVNHLLRNADGLRLAVLVNEFGALPIDGDLIESQSGNVISIAGGCVCCSYGNDLVIALQDLAAMDAPIDHVLLEASGVAMPGAIAATVSLIAPFALDGIVVLADAETIVTSAADRYMGDTITAQLAEADLVILNKTDLVSEAVLADTTRLVASIAQRARVVTATRTALPPAVVLESFLGRDRPATAARQHDTANYATVALPCPEPVDAQAFADALIADGYIRAKGFVTTADGTLVTVQIVGTRVDISPAPPNARHGVVGIRLRRDG